MTLREVLKTETRSQHDATENHFAALMDPNLTIDTYLNVLKQMAGFHREFENLLFQLPDSKAAQFYLNDRTKLNRLLRDQKVVEEKINEGRKKQTQQFKTQSCPIDFKVDHNEFAQRMKMALKSSASSEASLWGFIYVIEGSTLGGQIISKNIQQSLDLDPTAGIEYFSGYGVNNNVMWRRFLFELDNPEAQAQPQSAVQGAKLAFSWMAGH